VKPLIEAARAVTNLPLAVGFGISRPEHVAELGRHVEAVVVGSAIVNTIARHAQDPDLEQTVEDFVRELKSGNKPPNPQPLTPNPQWSQP